MSWFVGAVKKYAVFAGRARRKEFWFFYLFYVIFALAAAIVDSVLGTEYSVGETASIGLFSSVFVIAMMLPTFAVLARRLHDIGRSGWWILIGLIPIIGAIVLLIFTVRDSQEGENRFGPNPKEAAAA